MTSLEQRFVRLGQDTKPVAEDEIFEVIRRRLFEDLGSEEQRKQVIDRYAQHYTDLAFNHEVPETATKQSYRTQMEKSYPFHPELIDVFESDGPPITTSNAPAVCFECWVPWWRTSGSGGRICKEIGR